MSGYGFVYITKVIGTVSKYKDIFIFGKGGKYSCPPI
jgi:hypothetical protein